MSRIDVTTSIRVPAFRRAFAFLVWAVVAGAVYGFAWRSSEFGWLGILGLSLFLLQQYQCQTFWQTLMGSVLTGTVAYALACSWLPFTISHITEIDSSRAVWLVPLVCAAQGGHFVLFAILWFFGRKIAPSTWILAPIGWVVIEEFWPGLFPCRAGNLLDSLLLFCQTASIGGVQLVSLLALIFAGGLACLAGLIGQILMGNPIRTDWCRAVMFSIVVLIVNLWFGDMNLHLVRSKIKAGDQTRGLQVLLIQADTDFSNSHSKMVKISRQFEKQVDLIIWPESALGEYQDSLVDFSQIDPVPAEGAVVENALRPFPDPATCLLAGGDTWKQTSESNGKRAHFVSAYLIDKQERVTNRHDKVYLMPYGELIPGELWFPKLRSWFGRDREISGSQRIHPIGKIAGTTIGAVLCCEDMQPELIRKLVLQQADLLVTLGNGTAFDSEIALRQHFRIARMRAIENRRYFLRCTSHGISGLVAPTGDLLVELPVQKDVATPISVPNPLLGQTLFTRLGWRITCPLLFGISLCSWLMVRKISLDKTSDIHKPSRSHRRGPRR